MAGGPQARLLPDGRRLHLHHGPIDLVIGAAGGAREVGCAYAQARERFATVLAELVGELDGLRRPAGPPKWRPRGTVARRMVEAVWPHRGVFVTPMAAVAGAVADEVLAAMTAGRRLASAYVNNGGDIALHLAPGARLRLGLVGDLRRPALDAVAEVSHDDLNVRGIATSGWTGRSLSLGLADAVTVLARDAAAADAAATLIANEVDVDDPAIRRRPAREVCDDTDLGDRLVTVAVGDLGARAVEAALDAGAAAARRMREAGLIEAAVVLLRERSRVVGDSRAAIAA